MDDLFKCPCCGYPTLRSRGDYEVCYLCNWEDDGQDDFDADTITGGPNGDYSLTEARQNYKRYLTMYRPSDPAFGQSKKMILLKKQIIEKYDSMKDDDLKESQREINDIKLELRNAKEEYYKCNL